MTTLLRPTPSLILSSLPRKRQKIDIIPACAFIGGMGPQRVWASTRSGVGSSAGRNHYETLGVGKEATKGAIKAKFYKLSKVHHPDANPNKPGSASRFQEISEAYSILSDDRLRRAYDRALDPHDSRPTVSTPRRSSQSTASPYGKWGYQGSATSFGYEGDDVSRGGGPDARRTRAGGAWSGRRGPSQGRAEQPWGPTTTGPQQRANAFSYWWEEDPTRYAEYERRYRARERNSFSTGAASRSNSVNSSRIFYNTSDMPPPEWTHSDHDIEMHRPAVSALTRALMVISVLGVLALTSGVFKGVHAQELNEGELQVRSRRRKRSQEPEPV